MQQKVRDPRAYWQNVRETVISRDKLEQRVLERQAALDGLRASRTDVEHVSGGGNADAVGEIVARRERELERFKTAEVRYSALIEQAYGIVERMRLAALDGCDGYSVKSLDFMEDYYLVADKQQKAIAKEYGYSLTTFAHELSRAVDASAGFMPMVSE